MDDFFLWALGAFLILFLLARPVGEKRPTRVIEASELSASALAAVDAALARKAKIEAIKIVREDTGAGLKEAKQFVDARFVPKERKGDPIER